MSLWKSTLPVALYRLTRGRGFGGVLLLRTTGRRSGQQRTTPVQYLREDGAFVVVAANGGAPRPPAWLLNLRADPHARVQVRSQATDVTAREAGGDDYAALWRRLTAANPALDKLAPRRPPILVLAPRERVESPSEDGVDLYWLPLGAGGHVVRANGRLYEALAARLQHRDRRDLYHAALEVHLAGDRYVIEQAPVWNMRRPDRGVVVEGPVGTRRLGRFRLFRYEIRRWREGVIPDRAEAVAGPQRVSSDPAAARRVLDLVPRVPAATWGRDEQHTGEMWNSNSVIAWLLASSGHDTGAIHPPAGGRAPGWSAGLAIARP